MRIFAISLLLINCIFINASNRLDSLLKVLDKTVEIKLEYTAQKEQQITALKYQLSYSTVDEQRFNLTDKLFKLYSNYKTDSAFYVAKERVALANKIGNTQMIGEANMNMAEALRTTGMYKEALELLDEIQKKGWNKYNEGYYMHLRHSLYLLMSDYSIADEDKRRYNSLIFNYKDSILKITPEDDISYYLVTSTKNIMLGEYQKALETMKVAYTLDVSKAMVTYTMSEIYKYLGDTEQEKIYLAESAIADLKSGIKEYISLQELAAILFREGDVDRAYSYMKTSMDDAIFCNARLRMLEISRMLPIINESYDLKMQKEQNRLYWRSVVAIILAVVLLVTLSYIYRQMKTLSSIRKYQKKMNVELKAMNEELNNKNSELVDSNLIKEEYIGYVFNICSTYIDKLENFRITVNRKIKAGQTSDLEKMTSTSSLVADELKDFYKNFDSIFLNIYPTFIEDFNALMVEDGKIVPKDGDLLTPELRIYALVRLGINDSMKIADFLHYSPQTIYNYRLKIRNKMSVSKDEFPIALSQIGLSKSNK